MLSHDNTPLRNIFSNKKYKSSPSDVPYKRMELNEIIVVDQSITITVFKIA